MSYTCRLCNKGINDIKGAYLTRVNEKGVPGIWECRPNCGAVLTQETLLLIAINTSNETNKENM